MKNVLNCHVYNMFIYLYVGGERMARMVGCMYGGRRGVGGEKNGQRRL